jgi:DNA (cytosine-5)-methyltransferase 1
MSSKNYMIDLFSGCGGLSYGFEQAGFECVVGVDQDAAALKTFKYNHKNAEALQLDLSKDESIHKIVEAIGGRKIDLIAGGPPCQGFSLTGTRRENDSRNTLFRSMFKLAEKVQPTFMVLENVAGIANLYEGRAKNAIYEEFRRLEYEPYEKLIYAPDYGVPQIRKRMFFVGCKKQYVFSFPKATHSREDYVSCSDAISDLPSCEDSLGKEEVCYKIKHTSKFQREMGKGAPKLYNHVATKHMDHVISVIKQVPEGGNHKDLPEGVGDSRKFNEAWTRYHSQKPSKTIDTGHGNHFHYIWNRVPTVRENARLQSFPDKFRFLGSKTQQHRQVGNAVPPMLGKVLGKKFLSLLEK